VLIKCTKILCKAVENNTKATTTREREAESERERERERKLQMLLQR